MRVRLYIPTKIYSIGYSARGRKYPLMRCWFLEVKVVVAKVVRSEVLGVRGGREEAVGG